MPTKNQLAIVAVLLGLASSITAAQGQTPIDRQGWRFWNGNWDNTCFRTLNHLDTPSACSGGGAG